MNVDPQSVHTLCMGEHGDSQIIPWSQIIKAVLRDENKVNPVSAMLNGEYGEEGI